MKVYIAYKFSNIQNKQALREEIQSVSIILEGKGHSTFILGRDLQKWKDYTHKMPHKMRTILSELKKSDCVFAYINAPVFSRGLLFELVFARLFGKKVMIAVRESVGSSIYDKFADKVITYKRLGDLDDIDCNFN
jgi:hypothetical protein